MKNCEYLNKTQLIKIYGGGQGKRKREVCISEITPEKRGKSYVTREIKRRRVKKVCFVMGNTDIMMAAKQGEIGIFENNKISVDIKDDKGWTPLHWAVSGNKMLLIKELIKQGFKVNAESLQGLKPINIAINNGYTRVTDILLANGSIGNQKAFCDAAFTGQYKALKELFVRGNIKINETIEKDQVKGVTALHLAAGEGNYREVKFLLGKEQIKFNSLDNNGQTALHYASKNGQCSIVSILLKTGSDPDIQDVNGNTALHLAVQNNKSSIITEILKLYPGNAELKNKEEKTPCEIAAEIDMNTKNMMERTLETVEGNSVNMRSEPGTILCGGDLEEDLLGRARSDAITTSSLNRVNSLSIFE